MGRQIRYYIEYDSFLTIAQAALDCGCIIIKEDLAHRPTKVIQSRDISIVTRDCWSYHFYLPEAGNIKINTYACGERLDHGVGEGGMVLIEAGPAIIREENKQVTSNRMYVKTGYYDNDGAWIPRPDCLNKLYDKLVRLVKKAAPNKGYISDYCLKLREEHGYKLV